MRSGPIDGQAKHQSSRYMVAAAFTPDNWLHCSCDSPGIHAPGAVLRKKPRMHEFCTGMSQRFNRGAWRQAERVHKPGSNRSTVERHWCEQPQTWEEMPDSGYEKEHAGECWWEVPETHATVGPVDSTKPGAWGLNAAELVNKHVLC